LNCQMEQLSGNFTSLSLMTSGEHVGFYFNKSVAECSMFNMKLKEQIELLQADSITTKALHEIAAQREKKLMNACMKLAKQIDIDVLLKGSGSAEHEHELYKLLAVAGIKQEDLKRPDIMKLI